MCNLRILIILSFVFLISCTTTNQAVTSPQKEMADMGRGLDYTCRLPDGKIIATTDPVVAASPDYPKADVFIERTNYGPADITDLSPEDLQQDQNQLQYLEEVVIVDLVKKADNWPLETPRTFVIDTKAQMDLPEIERTIQLARIKTNPKTIRYAKSIFKRVTAAEPEIGEHVVLHEGVNGIVTAVEGDAVVVEFKPLSKGPIDGPFGPVIVTDQGDHYRIEIDAQEGTLVRVGPAVGLIAEVSGRNFRVDYAHAFGGETLTCDAKMITIPRKPTESVKVIQPEVDAAGAEPKPAYFYQRIAQKGDLAVVAGTARLQSGEVVWTTREDVATDPKQNKIDGYKVQEAYGPQTVFVGGDELFPGLAEGLEGMKLGDGNNITVPSADIFGSRIPGLMRQYDRTKIMPVRQTVPADVYVKQFGGFPLKGKTVKINEYTNAKVIDTTEKGAILQLSPVSSEVDSDFGMTRMKVIDDQIHIHLTPKLGANFELEDKKGIVVSVDDRKFTVDFNKPYAGEDVKLHIQLIGLKKASSFAGIDIEWTDDYGKGIEIAEKENKPTVLVLYADWCKYCKKLFNTTLVDPRIKMMGDDFVWVKANSDKDRGLKEIYGQKGFPLTVVLDSTGEVLGSINGYRPANEYQAELKKILGNKNTALKTETPDNVTPNS